MSRKISDFFSKKSMKLEPKEEESKEFDNQNSSKNMSVRLKSEEDFSTFSNDPGNNSSLNENSGQEKIHENVKTEAEKQLLIILPQQKVQGPTKLIKTEKNEPKIGKLQCKICQKYFKTSSTLFEHQKIHNKQFQCNICNKKFPNKYSLNDHIKYIHENPKSFKCNICDLKLNTKNNLKLHQRTHNKNRPKNLKCSQCDYTTDLKGNFNIHIKTHERTTKCKECGLRLYQNKLHTCGLNCKFCGKTFNHSHKVLSHIKNHHAHETGICYYECDICGLKFHQKNYLIGHMKSKHVNEESNNFTCDLDGKTFKSKSNIYQHMKSHLTPIKCNFCERKLKANYLKDHIRKFHSGLNPKTFKCHICFKTLTSKTILKRHVSEHNKTIKCNFCEKLFGNQSRLKEHIKIYHENPKSYNCEICDKKYDHLSSINNHMKTHDPNRSWNFKCSQCDYRIDSEYSFKAHLNYHERRNAKYAAIKNPHKCLKCTSVFENSKSLKSHMNNVHPKVLVECDVCGKKMKIKGDLLDHLKMVHKTVVVEN